MATKKSKSTAPQAVLPRSLAGFRKIFAKLQIRRWSYYEQAKDPSQPRMLKKQQYRSFRLHRRIRPYQPPLPSSRKILKRSIVSIIKRWKVYLGITFIYLLLVMILVKGFSSTLDIEGTKDLLDEFYQGFSGKALSAAAIFGSLISSTNGSDSAAANVYQSLLTVTIILAIVWVARQQRNKAKVRVRDAFYQGMYPLVPFVLITMAIGLQLAPLGIGGWLYSAVIGGGVAVTVIEKALWIVLILLLGVLSLYMVTSSIFALFIVTLPNMTPVRALRSARQLTLHRRWAVIRKILYLIVVLIISTLLVMLPFIVWLPQVAEWVFFAISGFGLLIPVTYLYGLYRELLNE